MRDAFGSTFMFKIIIIFIVAYVSFMTIAVNYAKTFRVKNGVINILEQYQYNDGDDTSKLDEYLSSMAYNVQNVQVDDHCDGDFIADGVCVNSMGDYYVVTVYSIVAFPFFDFTFVIPISGETEDVIIG